MGIRGTSQSRAALRRLAIISVVAATTLASAPALAAELYVSTSGNDSSGTGTLQNPYRTVKRAISAGRAGDTITLRAPANNRTYNECDVRLRQRMTLQTYAGEGKARIHCAITTADTVTIQFAPQQDTGAAPAAPGVAGSFGRAGVGCFMAQSRAVRPPKSVC